MADEEKDKNYKAFREGTLKYWLFIKDGEVSINMLKDHFTDIDWQRVPRQLNHDHSDFFYIGTYKDSERKININLRPSGRVQITESLLDVVKDRSSYVDRGNHIEMIATERMIEKIKEIARNPDKIETKVLDWD